MTGRYATIVVVHVLLRRHCGERLEHREPFVIQLAGRR
jgi:hypothetical protein